MSVKKPNPEPVEKVLFTGWALPPRTKQDKVIVRGSRDDAELVAGFASPSLVRVKIVEIEE